MRLLYYLFLVPFLSTSAFAATQPKPVIQDSFLGTSRDKWEPVSGAWTVDQLVEIYDIDKKDIYRSPEEPSFVEWMSLWKQKDGSARICFAEIKGNPGLEPSYVPWYGNGEPRERWEAFTKEHHLGFGPFEEAQKTTTVVYPTLVSKDGGDTWQNMGTEMEPKGANLRFAVAKDGSFVNHGITTITCKDGRLLSNLWPHEWRVDGKMVYDQYLCAVRESLDNGKTWSPNQFIRPEGSDPKMIAESVEESGMVELEDGRMLMIVRCDPGAPVQTYLTRVGPGKYEATPPTLLPMGNAGLPEMTRCKDGTIWYFGIDGHWYTLDDGKSWHKLPQVFTSYYGKMTDIGPSRLMCVSQKGTYDSPYPWYTDSCVEQLRFSYRKIGVAKHNDATSRLSIIKRSGQSLKDMQLRVKVKLDKADGMAFRMSPDGKSGYLFAIVMPGSEAYERWFAQKPQEATLSAINPDERYIYPMGNPFAVIARIDDGVLKVLRGAKVHDVHPGSWLQLQVKATGNLIQAAINGGNDTPRYVGVKDSTYKAGTIGLMSDQSQGEFKDICAWDKPLMIRDLWTLGAGDK